MIRKNDAAAPYRRKLFTEKLAKLYGLDKYVCGTSHSRRHQYRPIPQKRRKTMKTEIILDGESLAKLMKNRDVAIRIKDVVVKTVSEQLVAELKPMLTKRIRADVDNMIKAVLHADAANMFYPNRDESVVKLACMAQDEIRKAVNHAFTQNVENTVYAKISEQEDRLCNRVDEMMQAISKKRLQEIVKYAAMDIVEKTLRKGFGCKV